jgi:RHS repeat-associated protein
LQCIVSTDCEMHGVPKADLSGHLYDANGNTISDAQGRSFTWDFENRLTQVVNPGVGTTTVRHDPFGRRIQKSGPLGATNYLYDGMNDIEDMDNAGNMLARYTGRQERDQPLAELRSGLANYYEADGLGSVTSLSTSSATLAATYAYDSFGKITSSTGTLINPVEYTAREFDSETGLLYYRARYYDQTAGRFISEDPMGFNGGFNFYRYVKNSPANYIDPYGLATCYLWFQNGHGTLYCVPDDPNVLPLAMPVASGNNVGKQCKNNQACEKMRDQGPIPHGWWDWKGASQSHARSGGRNLEPMPGTDVLDLDGNPRNGILSHSCAYPFGPSTNPTNVCSGGCVTSTVEDIELLNSLIDAEPNSKVYVYGPGEGGPFH